MDQAIPFTKDTELDKIRNKSGVEKFIIFSV